MIFGVDEKEDFVLKRVPGKVHGYAARPGTGPEGESCKTCSHFYRHEMAKTYFKCNLMRAVWTGGPGTDIRANSPACRRWEKPQDKDDQPVD